MHRTERTDWVWCQQKQRCNWNDSWPNNLNSSWSCERYYYNTRTKRRSLIWAKASVTTEKGHKAIETIRFLFNSGPTCRSTAHPTFSPTRRCTCYPIRHRGSTSCPTCRPVWYCARGPNCCPTPWLACSTICIPTRCPAWRSTYLDFSFEKLRLEGGRGFFLSGYLPTILLSANFVQTIFDTCLHVLHVSATCIDFGRLFGNSCTKNLWHFRRK